MNWLKQRFNDWRQERRIKALGKALCEARKRGDTHSAHACCRQMMEAILTRSPEQQRRMSERVAKRIAREW